MRKIIDSILKQTLRNRLIILLLIINFAFLYTNFNNIAECFGLFIYNI